MQQFMLRELQVSWSTKRDADFRIMAPDRRRFVS